MTLARVRTAPRLVRSGDGLANFEGLFIPRSINEIPASFVAVTGPGGWNRSASTLRPKRRWPSGITTPGRWVARQVGAGSFSSAGHQGPPVAPVIAATGGGPVTGDNVVLISQARLVVKVCLEASSSRLGSKAFADYSLRNHSCRAVGLACQNPREAYRGLSESCGAGWIKW